MRYWVLAVGLAVSGLTGRPATAENYENTIEIIGAPKQNALVIGQSHRGEHVARIELQASPPETRLYETWHDVDHFGPVKSLAPSGISQSGLFHVLTLQIGGQNNLFAAMQSGERNTISGSIVGQLNQAAIIQTGQGNTASFIQVGQQNSVAIRQGM